MKPITLYTNLKKYVKLISHEILDDGFVSDKIYGS